jgi:large subunit ribosomal protein L9
MKLVLRDSVEKLGMMGEIVTVKDGFARNYLLPQGLAYPATDGFLNKIKNELEHKRKLIEKERQKAQLLAKEMENVSITIEVATGEEDKMFGSVTSANIVAKLHDLGYTLDKKKVLLSEPIRQLGIYHIPVKLHADVMVDIKVWVVKEKHDDHEAN